MCVLSMGCMERARCHTTTIIEEQDGLLGTIYEEKWGELMVLVLLDLSLGYF